MMKLLSAAAVAAFFCISAISAQAQHSHAQHSHASSRVYTLGSLKIERPWTRATPRSAPVAGGYLKVTNNGAVADRLVGGSFDLAGKVEVHEMSDVGGMMRMRQLPLGLEIAPGASVELRPGGYHLMFMDLKQGIVAGQNVKGALVFEKAGRIEVEFDAAPLGASAPAGGGHEHKH
jgi:copper(I)-binding protein